jgi:hypothetical protein
MKTKFKPKDFIECWETPCSKCLYDTTEKEKCFYFEHRLISI